MREILDSGFDLNEKQLLDGWRKVYENHGCCGSDGVSVENFKEKLGENLIELYEDITQYRYHPFPLLRFAVPKRSGQGYRYLCVPAVRDRVAQAAVFLKSRNVFEDAFEDVSHAYREGRGVKTAVYAIRALAEKGYRFAVDADITAYFDNINHERLITQLNKLPLSPEINQLFQKWIQAEIYDGTAIKTLDKGIPQGSVVSPLLANLFLDELDETLTDMGYKMVRYADDFLILCKSPKEAQEAIEMTDMILEDMELDLNPEKTKQVSFEQGFRFLGAVFLYQSVYLPFPQPRKADDFTPVLPPPLTLKRYLELKNIELSRIKRI